MEIVTSPPSSLGRIQKTGRERSMLRLLYWLYERRLRREIRDGPIPHHIGLILDGNRRFAQSHGIGEFRKVYDLGAQKLDDLLTWCNEIGISAITLWALSVDNLKRPPSEIAAILGAVETKIAALLNDTVITGNGIRIKAVGRLDLLPSSTSAVMRRAEHATRANRGLTLTIAIAYGGREEIADAVRMFIRQKQTEGASLETVANQISPEAIDDHLYTFGLPEPDLIIRTSGELRLSGFLLWQSAQSELYFCDVNWPEFRRIDFYRAIRAFQHRRRRFGQ